MSDNALVLPIVIADDVMIDRHCYQVDAPAVFEVESHVKQQLSQRVTHAADGKNLRATAEGTIAALHQGPASQFSHVRRTLSVPRPQVDRTPCRGNSTGQCPKPLARHRPRPRAMAEYEKSFSDTTQSCAGHRTRTRRSQSRQASSPIHSAMCARVSPRKRQSPLNSCATARWSSASK